MNIPFALLWFLPSYTFDQCTMLPNLHMDSCSNSASVCSSNERWGRTSAYQFIQRATILRCFNAFLKVLMLRTGVMVQLHWHVPNLHDSWNRLWDVSKIDWAVAFKIIAAWIWNEHSTGVNTVLKSEGFYAFFCWYFLAADSFLQDWITRARVHWFTFWRLSFQ